MLGKKRFALVFCLLMLVQMLSGCGSGSKADEVVAKVNGEPVYRWEYEVYLNQQLKLYKQIMSVDLTEAQYAKDFATYKESRLKEICSNHIAVKKAAEAGITLTSDEEASIETQYQQIYESGVATYMKDFGSDANARSKAEAKYAQSLKNQGLTPEKIKNGLREDILLGKFFTQLLGDTKPTDADIEKSYNDLLQTQKNTYGTTLSKFGENPPAILIYKPEGYVRVKHIFLQVDDSYLSKLKTIDAEISTKTNAYFVAISNKESDAVINAKASELAKVADLREKTLNEAVQSLMPKANEILSEIAKGASFDSLIQKYNQDTALSSKGYYVCKSSTNYEQAIIKAVMDLKAVGDISAPVTAGKGLYIIRLEEIVQSGITPLAEVKQAISDSLSGSNRFTAITKQKSEWLAAAQVEIYSDKL